MADVPSANDLFQVGRAEALINPTRFDAAIIDVPGSDVNIVFKVSAAMGEEVARFVQQALNELTLATSRGQGLDRFVLDRYGITRKKANAAVATLELSRSNTVGITVAAGSLFGTSTGQVFVSTVDAPFPAGSLGPVSIPVYAQQAGRDSNVPAGAITRVLSSVADSTLICTNPEAAAGGTNTESDAELIARARDFFPSARRGTRSAIEQGGLDTPGVVQAQAIEVLTSAGIAVYRVQLYVADPEGRANATLAAAVRRGLDEYRGFGVPVQVIPSVPQYVDIVVSGLQFEAGADTAAVLDRAANATLAAVNATEPGRTLYRSTIINTLRGIDRLIVPEGSVIAPAGDLVPTSGSVIRTTRDRIALGS